MRENLKKRMAVLLTLLMVLPTLVAVLPMTATEVQAASVSVSWNVTGSGSRAIQVEKGQKFYVGDYVAIYMDGKTQWSGTASMTNASYSSSNTSVASVNKDGYFTAKNTGTTGVTVKYKGKKAKCTFEIVEAGSLSSSSETSKLETAASAIAKSIPSSVSTKNGFNLRKKLLSYEKTADKFSSVSKKGFLKEKITSSYSSYYYYTDSVKLAVPQAGRYLTFEAILRDYAKKNAPTSTTSAKGMKIASVFANTSGITVKIKKKLDTAQILAAQIDYSYTNDTVSKTQATVTVSIVDENTNDYYYGYALLKKGSNTVKITPKKYSYSNGTGKYVSIKLTKGHKYSLGSKLSWTKGKTVVVK